MQTPPGAKAIQWTAHPVPRTHVLLPKPTETACRPEMRPPFATVADASIFLHSPLMTGRSPMPDAKPRPATPARVLRGSPGIEISLRHYAAGERQAAHQHDHMQISFLLAGGLCETIGRRDNEVTVTSACIKPPGTEHADLWGRSGAFMLAVRLKQAALVDGGRFETARWIACKAPRAELVRAALGSAAPAEVDLLAGDLVASLDQSAEVAAEPRPRWLDRVIEALWDLEGLSADAAAAIAGVHRVHLSRAFVRHMGIPFSVYRRRVMASRAVEAMLRTGAPLADVAASAGFSDQSHMHRALAALSGTTPADFRRRLS